jgi:Rrf2 family protein
MRVQVSARVEYALTAIAELASDGGRLTAERISAAAGIPIRFLLNILGDLVHAGIVTSWRGSVGGYELARPPSEIALRDVVRAVEPDRAGRAATRQGRESDEAAEAVERFRAATVESFDAMLESTTVADLLAGAEAAATASAGAPAD